MYFAILFFLVIIIVVISIHAREETRKRRELMNALRFYADPDTYFAIGWFPDSPCGEFIEDFDERYTDFSSNRYNRKMPGKLARETIRDQYRMYLR